MSESTTEAPTPAGPALSKPRIPARPQPRENRITLDSNGKPVSGENAHRFEIVGEAATAAADVLVTTALTSGNGGHTTPTQTLIAHGATAMMVARHVNRAAKKGYNQGLRQAALRRERSAFIPTKDIQDNGPEIPRQLVKDLISLSANNKTTLDLNRRLSPTAVAARANRMIARGGPTTTALDLPELGIRPTPNLIDALTNYTRGGRSQLVHGGIVEPQPHIDLTAHKDAEAAHSTEEILQKTQKKQTAANNARQNQGVEI